MVIPGSRRPERVQENAAAADVVLDESDLARIHEVLPHGAHGSRYPESLMPQG